MFFVIVLQKTYEAKLLILDGEGRNTCAGAKIEMTKSRRPTMKVQRHKYF